MCLSQKIFSCISLNLVQFSFRPILKPGPSQCVPLLRFFLCSNLADMVIIRKSELSGKIIFLPVLLAVRCGSRGDGVFRGYFCTFLTNVSYLTWQICRVSGKCVKSHLENVSFSCQFVHFGSRQMC